MTEYPDPKWAWKDGAFVPYDDCTIHVRTQAVMVAASVFEGIKAYWHGASRTLQLFRLEDHIQRLRDSMKIMRMGNVVPDDFGAICAELLARNAFTDDVHMMPTAYVGMGQGNVALAKPAHEGMFITGVSRSRSPLLDRGLRVCISSWTRISDNSVPPRVKAAGNYQNARLALNEAWANGFDNAIMLNATGTIAEGPGSCMMMVRHGQLCTPPVTAGILESITRDTLITLFEEKLGRTVIERPIDRTELYTAEEVFLCGSGMEVVPVVAVDHLSVGAGTKGPLTKAIQAAYFDVATGDDPAHPEWRTAVPKAH
jgi:branched-chain amino acid aminotransferase